MGIFDNKEIEELQAQTKKLEAQTKKLEAETKKLEDQTKKLKTENKDLSNDLSDQKSTLTKSLKEHKKTLDMVNKTMVPWGEYGKWEKMKDKLPHIEEMYDIKKLKHFVTSLNYFEKTELHQQERYARSLGDGGWSSSSEWAHRIKISTREIQKAQFEIRGILEKLRKHKKNKELVGLFKLYAISTDWLKPQ